VRPNDVCDSVSGCLIAVCSHVGECLNNVCNGLHTSTLNLSLQVIQQKMLPLPGKVMRSGSLVAVEAGGEGASLDPHLPATGLNDRSRHQCGTPFWFHLNVGL
jgi:hypothetical protein